MLQEDMAAFSGADLGDLAIRFLRRFGSMFDYAELAVSVRQGGIIPAAEISSVAQARKPGAVQAPRIIIEDPQEPGLSTGNSTYNIQAIAMSFEQALHALSDALRKWNACALEPAADTWLRDSAAARIEYAMPQLPQPDRESKLRSLKEMPPPAATLMLGRILSLDCAIGPHTPPYDLVREALAQHGRLNAVGLGFTR